MTLWPEGRLPQTKHGWVMPIRPEAYDRSPLSDAERQALAHYMIRGTAGGASSCASATMASVSTQNRVPRVGMLISP
jgi:hypothetical protein